MSHLVLLSGWGCDARIWQSLDGHWPTGVAVSAPDWPGYGARPPLDEPGDLAALAEAMSAALPTDAVWVGWSLGGLLAGALLDHLPAPRALVMLGMGPRFCHPQGVTEAELAAFRGAFRRDADATRAHFLRWQLGGEPAPRTAHRRLLDLLGRESPAATATLATGLDWLASLDVSRVLADPPCPVWRLAGEHDPLLAPEERARADIRLAEAGHCPMLSRPEAVAATLADIAQRPEHSLLEATP
ncbi:alpha/beta fold hydrolase [Halomonas cerina]|uniref:Pimeloyl-[acyl-carrier protein] methyl ester esterase n=1 Tax=Halomonas cerina TaxID=447424 RepID=A0A839V1U8_9GAMM|nr:alpha/beta fold hydrolase [Halomonas cerina]MBB3189332.1 pimeloyl-[acyl-carrier protein] methyl ester esterase [Halomonas cerina]